MFDFFFKYNLLSSSCLCPPFAASVQHCTYFPFDQIATLDFSRQPNIPSLVVTYNMSSNKILWSRKKKVFFLRNSDAFVARRRKSDVPNFLAMRKISLVYTRRTSDPRAKKGKLLSPKCEFFVFWRNRVKKGHQLTESELIICVVTNSSRRNVGASAEVPLFFSSRVFVFTIALVKLVARQCGVVFLFSRFASGRSWTINQERLASERAPRRPRH